MLESQKKVQLVHDGARVQDCVLQFQRPPLLHIKPSSGLGFPFEISYQVIAFFLLFQAGEDHLRAGDVLLRVEQVVVERVLAPLDTLVLVRGGVRETLRRAGDAAEQTAEVGALYAFQSRVSVTRRSARRATTCK